MKINVNRSSDRGITKFDWLNSRHSFSFGDYYEPKRKGFGVLRVLNDDIVGPSKGFSMHNHANFEIVSIVLEGALEHKDSMGNQGIIRAGEVQRISAGTGIMHSEFNPSNKEKVHFLQIWITPMSLDVKPSYEQKKLKSNVRNKLINIVSNEKNDNVYINQRAIFSLGNFNKNKEITYKLQNTKHGIFVFMIRGDANIGKENLKIGDSCEITEINDVKIRTNEETTLLIIEVQLD